MKGNNKPIGVFDSGIGGLTIAKAMQKEMPQERICYFGDTKHLPYGDKSKESIKEYSAKIAEYLFLKKKCKAIVIACNSASTSAASFLEKEYLNSIPIINVIDPTVEHVMRLHYKKVGLIGTKRTVSSQAYQKRFKKKNIHVDFVSRATPLLAPMIEEGFFNNKISQTIIDSYLNYDRFEGIEALILGCTHYPLILNEIKNYYDGKVDVVDSSVVTAKKVKEILMDHQILSFEKKEQDEFLISEYTKSFELSARQFFKKKIKLVEIKLFNS